VVAYTVDARPRVRKALRQLDPTVRKDVLVADYAGNSGFNSSASATKTATVVK
jgi:hypothetical protein